MSIGYVGTNHGFGLACREIRKAKMAGRDLTVSQMQQIYRKAMDIQHQYRQPPLPAA